MPIVSLLQDDAPSSSDDLALLYADRLRHSIRAWQAQSLSDDDTAFLDLFLRRDLLPTTLAALPHLREAVERYRHLEREIPIPRRAPGVLEAAVFDQPLFERGQHARPVQPVRRRGLSLLGATPFATSQSGHSTVIAVGASTNGFAAMHPIRSWKSSTLPSRPRRAANATSPTCRLRR